MSDGKALERLTLGTTPPRYEGYYPSEPKGFLRKGDYHDYFFQDGNKNENFSLINWKAYFLQCVDKVRLAKPYPAENPTKPFPRDIREGLLDLVFDPKKPIDPKRYNEIRFYTAVESPLDFLGIDAFMEMDVQGKSDPLLVTLDLTANQSKMRNKADIVVLLPPDGIDVNDDIYMDVVSVVSDAFYQSFQELLKEEGQRGRSRFFVDYSNLTKGVQRV